VDRQVSARRACHSNEKNCAAIPRSGVPVTPIKAHFDCFGRSTINHQPLLWYHRECQIIAVAASHPLETISEMEEANREIEDCAGVTYDPGMTEASLLERITVDPKIFDGKPIIRGRRLAVEHVLGMLAAGDTAATILESYSWLERDDIQACLLYARRIVAHERFEPVFVDGGK
jgi:uncharacterized protein (DUF433 family)